MKNLNELKTERVALVEKMDAISKAANITDEQRTEFDKLDGQVKVLESDIARVERQEELNKKIASINIVKTAKDDDSNNWSRAITEYFDKGNLSNEFRGNAGGIVIPRFAFRADPIITTTDAGLINKSVAPLSILMSPGEAFLAQLGVPIYAGLSGNLALPTAAQVSGGFVAEGSDVSTAGFSPSTITLSPRGVGLSNAWSKEFSATSNPDILGKMIQALYNAVWVEVAKDLFVQIKTDAAVSTKTVIGGTLAYSTVTGMEASLGDFTSNAKYVTTPYLRNALKNKFTNATYGSNALWMNDQINGYPAMAASMVSASNIFFGDFSQGGVAQFGNPELILDPYLYAASRKVKATLNGLFDTGYANPRGMVWIADASAY